MEEGGGRVVVKGGDCGEVARRGRVVAKGEGGGRGKVGSKGEEDGGGVGKDGEGKCVYPRI